MRDKVWKVSSIWGHHKIPYQLAHRNKWRERVEICRCGWWHDPLVSLPIKNCLKEQATLLEARQRRRFDCGHHVAVALNLGFWPNYRAFWRFISAVILHVWQTLELRINLMRPFLVCIECHSGIDSKRTLWNKCSTYAGVIDDLFESIDFLLSSVHHHMNIAYGSLAEALSNTIMLNVTHGSRWCFSVAHWRRQRITKLLASARASQSLVHGKLRWACGHGWSRHVGDGGVGLTHLKLRRRGKLVEIAPAGAQLFALPESCHQILLLLFVVLRARRE